MSLFRPILHFFFLTLSLCISTVQCQFFDLFKSADKPGDTNSGGGGINAPVIGPSIGNKAGSLDQGALDALHAVESSHAPSAIRPDPDTFIRLLLNQYRTPSATTARQIALVEAYRPLVGGASTDFQKKAQLSYDATSLLSLIKVAEIVCEGLVAPDSWTHSGWTTILPNSPSLVEENILYLAQRFLGKPSSKIDSSYLQDLISLYNSARGSNQDNVEFYIPVCTALALDAEALFL